MRGGPIGKIQRRFAGWAIGIGGAAAVSAARRHLDGDPRRSSGSVDKDLQDIVHELRGGVYAEGNGTADRYPTASGKAFLDMLGVFAEFETNLRRERQIEGIAEAKAKRRL